MVSRPSVVILLFLSAACREEPREVVMRIVSLEREAILMSVTNNTAHDVVLLSPEAPTRQVDGPKCAITVSTVADRQTYAFAFTPTLHRVRARSATRFRATLKPLTVSRQCQEWNIEARLAYLTDEEVQRFRTKSSAEFHGYVLAQQHVVTVHSKARCCARGVE